MENFTGRGSACMVVLVVSLLAFIRGSFAAQYVVGDQNGWSLPSTNGVNYSSWSASHTFYRGDSLVFDYPPDVHNVRIVDETQYTTCILTNPQGIAGGGHTVLNLTVVGDHFFVCGVVGHCDQGQKLKVFVNANAGSPGPVTIPASQVPSPAPPSPGSSGAHAPSLSFTSFALSVIVGAVVAGYLSLRLVE
ncbi:hypothetical protein O6H91_04G023700 [Diphasiastrum complanatum]|uniref:Uncharacterized protein n=2 Tax=Diphasiastrum complanatum TaxID=34168 RepID=A0ACC2DVA7_DIPCM|nr:hypothetical protein O6H91_04G023700 [Diphasiastrum complanatum]KAJ7558070.1 hypothetical protein O6H91_04G023700 [Diphasiastrum complanatum]